MPHDLALVQKVLDRRMRAASVDERRRLGALWCDRAIRVHLAGALGEVGSLEASALARTAPAVSAERVGATVALLARISSAHPASPPSGPPQIPNVELAVQALTRALDHLRVVDADAQELPQLSNWIAKAVIALGKPAADEIRAALDDLGGLSDA